MQCSELQPGLLAVRPRATAPTLLSLRFLSYEVEVRTTHGRSNKWECSHLFPFFLPPLDLLNLHRPLYHSCCRALVSQNPPSCSLASEPRRRQWFCHPLLVACRGPAPLRAKASELGDSGPTLFVNTSWAPTDLMRKVLHWDPPLPALPSAVCSRGSARQIWHPCTQAASVLEIVT